MVGICRGRCLSRLRSCSSEALARRAILVEIPGLDREAKWLNLLIRPVRKVDGSNISSLLIDAARG